MVCSKYFITLYCFFYRLEKEIHRWFDRTPAKIMTVYSRQSVNYSLPLVLLHHHQSFSQVRSGCVIIIKGDGVVSGNILLYLPSNSVYRRKCHFPCVYFFPYRPINLLRHAYILQTIINILFFPASKPHLSLSHRSQPVLFKWKRSNLFINFPICLYVDPYWGF